MGMPRQDDAVVGIVRLSAAKRTALSETCCTTASLNGRRTSAIVIIRENTFWQDRRFLSHNAAPVYRYGWHVLRRGRYRWLRRLTRDAQIQSCRADVHRHGQLNIWRTQLAAQQKRRGASRMSSNVDHAPDRPAQQGRPANLRHFSTVKLARSTSTRARVARRWTSKSATCSSRSLGMLSRAQCWQLGFLNLGSPASSMVFG